MDFANCVAGEDELPSNTQAPPAHPNDIDRGYLRGLRTLKAYFGRILSDIKTNQVAELSDWGELRPDLEISNQLLNGSNRTAEESEVSI